MAHPRSKIRQKKTRNNRASLCGVSAQPAAVIRTTQAARFALTAPGRGRAATHMAGPTLHNNANDHASRFVLCRTSRWHCATLNKTAKPAQVARRATTRRRKPSCPVLDARQTRENTERHTMEVPGWLEGARPTDVWTAVGVWWHFELTWHLPTIFRNYNTRTPTFDVLDSATRLDSTRLDSTRLDLTRLDSTRHDLTRLDLTRLEVRPEEKPHSSLSTLNSRLSTPSNDSRLSTPSRLAARHSRLSATLGDSRLSVFDLSRHETSIQLTLAGALTPLDNTRNRTRGLLAITYSTYDSARDSRLGSCEK